MSASKAIDFRPEAAEFLADPYPFYRRLREEDPVHWSPRLKAWVLTRYDDVKSVLLDRAISSDRMRPFFATLPGPEAARIGDIIRYLSTWMVFRDPPDHSRLRRLTGKVFNVQSMHAMQPTVEELVAWLLERIGEREQVDFIADFAGPLPALVIMAMLGVPHLSFGFGMHICLGFPLSRLEGQIALPAVLARWPRIELAVPEAKLEWLNSMVFRGMKSLPLNLAR